MPLEDVHERDTVRAQVVRDAPPSRLRHAALEVPLQRVVLPTQQHQAAASVGGNEARELVQHVDAALVGYVGRTAGGPRRRD